MSIDLNELANDQLQQDPRARNAVKTGMAARRVAVADEDAAGFDALRTELIAHWRPKNVTTFMLVDHLARCQWRLMRAGESEIRMVEIAQEHRRGWDGNYTERHAPLSATHAMANDLVNDRSGLARLQMFQGRLERSIHRTIHLLLTMRKSRGKQGNSGRNKAT